MRYVIGDRTSKQLKDLHFFSSSAGQLAMIVTPFVFRVAPPVMIMNFFPSPRAAAELRLDTRQPDRK
jgi:hypothetical protein